MFWTAFWYYPAALLYHLMYLKSSMNSDCEEKIPGPKFMFKGRVKSMFPNASALHNFYGSLMHEGQMMDGRMCINSLLTTSIDQYHPGQKGASLANYVQFDNFTKSEAGKIDGAVLTDNISGKTFNVKAKAVVNCTGIFADNIRQLDNEKAESRIVGSRGTHLIFKGGSLPANSGFIIPETTDGRLLFTLNYMGQLMVGTTDVKCDVTHECKPSQDEIDFIIKEIKPYFPEGYDFEANLVSTFAGIRPLALSSDNDYQPIKHEGFISSGIKSSISKFASLIHGKKKTGTSQISRMHQIEVSDSGLVSLLGGKWTSFRHMGQDTLDCVLKHNPEIEKNLKHDTSQTMKFKFIGSYSRLEAINGYKSTNQMLFNQYEDHLALTHDMDRDISRHLVEIYGTASTRVIEMGYLN
jgi:glycerol-3-phosphate dehydrogenase